jgi:drug/metabolite transporter (DMT)-like permease
MNERRSPIELTIAIIIAIISVSTASIFIKFAQKEAPSLVIAALRLIIASIIIAPFAIRNHKKELLSLTRNEFLMGLLSGFFLALHFATWISSLEYTSVTSSVVLVSTGPLWVAIFSPLFLRESLTKNIIWGMLLALIGGTIVAISDTCSWQTVLSCPSFSTLLNGKSMQGNLLALFGAFTVSGYLLIGRRLRSRMSLVPYIFVVYSMAAVVLFAIMLIAKQSPFGYPLPTYGWILLLAVIPQIIGHSTYNWALRFLPATLVAILTLGEPIGSAILAFFILYEKPGAIKIIGALLILTGIYVAARNRRSENH